MKTITVDDMTLLWTRTLAMQRGLSEAEAVKLAVGTALAAIGIPVPPDDTLE